LASAADQVACGDINGDGVSDLMGVWTGQAGVWIKYSGSGSWSYLGSSPLDLASGKMGGGAWIGSAGVPGGSGFFIDLSDSGPSGLRFRPGTEKNLNPGEGTLFGSGNPGPGEPGFTCLKQRNLTPSARVK
jgi:hypothetical protein